MLCQYVALTVPIILSTHVIRGLPQYEGTVVLLIPPFPFYFVITFLEWDYVSDHVLSFFCRVVYYLTLVNFFFFYFFCQTIVE